MTSDPFEVELVVHTKSGPGCWHEVGSPSAGLTGGGVVLGNGGKAGFLTNVLPVALVTFSGLPLHMVKLLYWLTTEAAPLTLTPPLDVSGLVGALLSPPTMPMP